MRLVIAIAVSFIATSAQAHIGHIGELAGHGHLIGAAAAGAAIAIGIWAGLKGRGKGKAETEEDTAETETPQEA